MIRELFRRLFRKGHLDSWPVIGGQEWHGFLREHRFLIEICLKQNAEFHWTGPGALLIKRNAVELVVEEAIQKGFVVHGFEAFTIDNKRHYAHLDPIADFTRSDVSDDPTGNDPLKRLSTWPPDIWVDVAGYLPDSVKFD